jgi:hypothetical protein
MKRSRPPWINVAAGVVGGIALGLGLGRLYFGATLAGVFWAVAGFLLVGWAVWDRRAATPGTPESEADGGHTVE